MCGGVGGWEGGVWGERWGWGRVGGGGFPHASTHLLARPPTGPPPPPPPSLPLGQCQAPDDASTTMLDVARTVASFLQAFFASPTYASLRGRKIFLTGESYAGEAGGWVGWVGGWLGGGAEAEAREGGEREAKTRWLDHARHPALPRPTYSPPPPPPHTRRALPPRDRHLLGTQRPLHPPGRRGHGVSIHRRRPRLCLIHCLRHQPPPLGRRQAPHPRRRRRRRVRAGGLPAPSSRVCGAGRERVPRGGGCLRQRCLLHNHRARHQPGVGLERHPCAQRVPRDGEGGRVGVCCCCCCSCSCRLQGGAPPPTATPPPNPVPPPPPPRHTHAHTPPPPPTPRRSPARPPQTRLSKTATWKRTPCWRLM